MNKLKPTHYFQKDISNCGLTGFISKTGQLVEGSVIIKSITLMHDRGNGLGGGLPLTASILNIRISLPCISCMRMARPSS